MNEIPFFCDIANFHKNRNKKWWLKYIGAWVVGIVTFGIVNFLNEIWEDKR